MSSSSEEFIPEHGSTDTCQEVGVNNTQYGERNDSVVMTVPATVTMVLTRTVPQTQQSEPEYEFDGKFVPIIKGTVANAREFFEKKIREQKMKEQKIKEQMESSAKNAKKRNKETTMQSLNYAAQKNELFTNEKIPKEEVMEITAPKTLKQPMQPDPLEQPKTAMNLTHSNDTAMGVNEPLQENMQLQTPPQHNLVEVLSDMYISPNFQNQRESIVCLPKDGVKKLCKKFEALDVQRDRQLKARSYFENRGEPKND